MRRSRGVRAIDVRRAKRRHAQRHVGDLLRRLFGHTVGVFGRSYTSLVPVFARS